MHQTSGKPYSHSLAVLQTNSPFILKLTSSTKEALFLVEEQEAFSIIF